MMEHCLICDFNNPMTVLDWITKSTVSKNKLQLLKNKHFHVAGLLQVEADISSDLTLCAVSISFARGRHSSVRLFDANSGSQLALLSSPAADISADLVRLQSTASHYSAIRFDPSSRRSRLVVAGVAVANDSGSGGIEVHEGREVNFDGVTVVELAPDCKDWRKIGSNLDPWVMKDETSHENHGDDSMIGVLLLDK